MPKLTKEEIENNLKKTQEELNKETQQPSPSKPAPSTPAPSPSNAQPSPSPAQPSPSQPQPTPSPSPVQPSPSNPPDPSPSPDYKKKFKNSSKEANRIYARNRFLNKAIREANELPEPTEDELKEMYDGWDVMTDFEKEQAKETLINKRFRKHIASAHEDVKKIEQWEEDVDKFIGDPKTKINNPELEGKDEAFKEFATRDENNNVPWKVLVAAFLHEQSKKTSKNKGEMFPQGKGKSDEKQKPKKLTIEEGAKLMKTDYKLYKKYLQENKIEMVPTS